MIKLNEQSGFILPTIIVIAIFLTMLSLTVSELAVNNLKLSIQDNYRVVAQLAADAGGDLGVVSLNDSNAWAGTGGEIDLFTENGVRATYEVTVVVDPVDDSIATITTTGRTYKPATSGTPKNEITYVLAMSGINNSGQFSLVTGVGGLVMRNSAKIVGGDVFVNGQIDMDNTSQIGLTTNPVNVEVAHQSCPDPADATYPTVCGPGNGEPITLNTSAHIYGDVLATNQTANSAMTDGGYLGPSAGPRALPATHDRDAQIAAVAVTRTGADASCTTNGGSVTWAANTKITGDVLIDKSCAVAMEGDVWIEGKLEMYQSGSIVVDDALLLTMPDLMIDGLAGMLMRNSSTLTSNASGTGMQVLTYYSTAACSPGCADVTGLDLFDSRDIITFDLDNSASAPDSILYARWTRVTINNSSELGALVGQTVALLNRTSITFGTAVPTPGSEKYTYLIEEYRREFN